MDARERVADERYRLLLSQLKATYAEQNAGKTHGWQRWAATQLKIRPEHVRLLLDGTRNAGGKIIERAVRAMGIASKYFYDATLKQPRYQDFPGAMDGVRETEATYGRPVAEGDLSALWVFLGRGTHAPVSPDEIERLRAHGNKSHRKGGLTPLDFAEALDLIRDHGTQNREPKR